jgi:hypothetical protein
VQLQLLSYDVGLTSFFKHFQRKAFLEESLKSMTVDVISVLLKAVDVLKTTGNLDLEDDPTESEEALQEISTHVDNIDIANGGCNCVYCRG